MFDNIFQMLWEFFLTLVWFSLEWTKSKIRNGWEATKNYFFHRTHTFIASDVWENERSAKFSLAILALASFSHADNFVGSPKDSLFFTDSTYIIQIALTQSNCAEATPCRVEVASPGGTGARFYNIYGDVDDTLAVLYRFPHDQFVAGTSWANLYFYGADGKAKDIWTIRLKYREVTTSSLGLRRRATGFRATGLAWNGRIDGRTF